MGCELRIDLCLSDGVGLIVPWPTGVLYTNQAGGHSCMQRAEEGVYIPLLPDNVRPTLDEQLCAHFYTGPKWRGWCAELDDESADFLDKLLTTFYWDLKVDRSLLRDSMEAWVHVHVCRHELIEPPIIRRAVLTWSNSD